MPSADDTASEDYIIASAEQAMDSIVDKIPPKRSFDDSEGGNRKATRRRFSGSPTSVTSHQVHIAQDLVQHSGPRIEDLVKPEMPAMRYFTALNQRTEWPCIVTAFQIFHQEQLSDLQISHDDIMDLSPDSRFSMSLEDKEFEYIAEDFPQMEKDFAELAELNELLGVDCSFLAIKDKIYNLPLNTPVRRFLYGIVVA